MYFKQLPMLYYAYDINGESVLKTVKDVTFNIRVLKNIIDSIVIYDLYDIRDDETIEIISSKLYGSAEYHWLLMILNEKYDLNEDFPLSVNQFDSYIQKKYNTFAATEWSFQGTTVTVTIPGHPIEVGMKVNISDGFVTIEHSVTGEVKTIQQLFGNTYTVTSTTDDTITFTAGLGSVLAPWDNKTATGGLTVRTTNRQYDTKHYEYDGLVVDSDYAGAVAVTYYDYEFRINEAKRRIKIISPSYISQILTEFKALTKMS